jgi:hypothetical protein
MGQRNQEQRNLICGNQIMSFIEHSINTPHSIQEDYSYHLEQASHFLEYAKKAQEEVKTYMEHFYRHNAWLKQHTNNFNQ